MPDLNKLTYISLDQSPDGEMWRAKLWNPTGGVRVFACWAETQAEALRKVADHIESEARLTPEDKAKIQAHAEEIAAEIKKWRHAARDKR